MSTPLPQGTVAASDHPPTSAPSEWQIDRLDVYACLARIGYTGTLAPSVETLTALHRAHALTIPFENLDIILGRGVSLDLEAIQGKLVHQRRGGYCFEHNLLFAALLEHLGFTVRRHLGRVLAADGGRIQPRTHMTLNVEIGGNVWHADVGFGTALSEPIPLVDGVEVTQAGWSHAIARDEAGHWRLRSLGAEGWSDRYVYTQERQYLIDYVAANHYTATHPDSHFTRQPVAVRLTPHARVRLNGREFTTTTPDGSSHRREVAPGEIGSLLRETFEIMLSAADIDRIVARLGD